MKRVLLMSVVLLACHSKKSLSSTSTGEGAGDTRTKKVEFYNSSSYLIKDTTSDKTYAFTAQNPVKVGGVKKGGGPAQERYYLNGLRGPNGEKLSYFRRGSCCSFQTPNGLIEGIGLLDHYRVSWGTGDTLSIYINMYDEGDLYVPVGLKGTID